jgi:hypothetical protein
MPEEDRKEEEHREDADGTQLDKFLSKMDAKLDSMSSRLSELEKHDAKKDDDDDDDDAKKDAVEDKEERKDAKEEKEERADASKEEEKEERKDARKEVRNDAKEEEKEERKDAGKEKEKEKEKEEAFADSIVQAVSRKLLSDVQKMLPKELTDVEHRTMLDHQARADRVFQAFSDSAPRPLSGENEIGYRRRLANKLKVHSPKWSKAKLDSLDGDVFDNIEAEIYSDAMTVGTSPAAVAPGTMQTRITHQGGHEIREYIGEPRAWMDDVVGPARQYVTKIGV